MEMGPKFLKLRELSKDVILAVEVQLITIDLNLGAAILGKQNGITSLERGDVQIAGYVLDARSDGNHLTLVGALGLVRGQVNATGGLGLLGRSSDQDAVAERSKGAGKGLRMGTYRPNGQRA